MPNWCQGKLKVRGTNDAIKHFLTEGIVPVSLGGYKSESIIEKDESGLMVKTNEPIFYIKNTHRAFIPQDKIYYKENNEMLEVDFQQAWEVSTEQLQEISKLFALDIDVSTDEIGVGFSRHVIIKKGTILLDEDISWKKGANL